MDWQDNAKSFAFTLLLTILLFLSGVAIPLIGVLLIPLVPYPALAFGIKHGRRGALGLLLSAGAILLMFSGKEAALGFFFFALMTVLLLSCFGRGWSIEAVVVGTSVGVLATASTISLLLSGSLSRLQEIARQALEENLQVSLKLYENAGLPTETVESARESGIQLVQTVLQITPALVFISLVAVVLINLLLLSYRFPEHHLFFSSLGDPKEWRAPEPLVWCFILSGFSLFLPSDWGLRILALNLLLVSSLFYFFQGLAIVAYFFHHKKVPMFLRGIGYILIAFQQLFTLFVVGLGLFDLWGDFRRLNKRDLNPTRVT